MRHLLAVHRARVQLDLGVLVPVSAVFAHGLRAAGRVAIETSADGIVWAEVTRLGDAGEHIAFTIPTGTFARFVRLTGLENGRAQRVVGVVKTAARA